MSFHLPRFDRGWFAIHVKPRAERSVSVILESKGYDQFVPVRSASIEDGGHIGRPLFPGYVFCRFGSEVLGPIVTTPGVIRILGLGNRPVAIPDLEIESIRTVVKAGLAIGPYPFFKNGDLVRICEGPLSGVEGKIASWRKKHLLILAVTLLQRSIAVEISPRSVIHVDSHQHNFTTAHTP